MLSITAWVLCLPQGPQSTTTYGLLPPITSRSAHARTTTTVTAPEEGDTPLEPPLRIAGVVDCASGGDGDGLVGVGDAEALVVLWFILLFLKAAAGEVRRRLSDSSSVLWWLWGLWLRADDLLGDIPRPTAAQEVAV